MEKSINQFVWKYSAKQQIVLVMMTIAYFPTLYALLELPKIIIDQVIGGPPSVDIFGHGLQPETALLFFTTAFLVLYLINALIKLAINIKKGAIGERLIQRLRYTLFVHLLRFPVQRFRVVSQGELISQINSEAETLAGYISEAITLPLFQGGTMITVLFFMFAQSFWLGLAALVLIPLQMLVVPGMQRKVNVLNHKRVRQVRRFSEYIGETVSGSQAIRTNGVQRYVLSGFSDHLSRLFDVRLRLYRQKYLIKFVTNFLNQLTPFLFYLIGGLLVIKGSLSIGALVAAIAGHKDMVAPWKELLKYYQMQQDAKIKYEQLAMQFDIADSDQTDYFVDVPARDSMELFPLRLNNVVTEEDGKRILTGFSFEANAGEHIAVIEPDSDKRLHIAELILSLRQPVYGSAWLGDRPIKDTPGGVKSRRLAFQPSSPPIFNMSVYENILLSIKHIPAGTAPDREKQDVIHSENNWDTFNNDWNDFEHYQFGSKEDLYDWYFRVMEAADADQSVIGNALFQYYADDHSPEQAEKIVRARPLVFDALSEHQITIQNFDEREWCSGLSIAENLAFCKLIDESVTPGEALYSDEVAQILSDNGFDRIVEQMGRQIVTMIIGGLSSDISREATMHVFRLVSETQAEDIVSTGRSILKKSSHLLTESEKRFLLVLFFNLVLEDHQGIQLPGTVVSRIMFIRDEIDSVLDSTQRARLQRFEYSQFHPGLTVLENLMFGLLPVGISNQSLDTVLDIVEQLVIDSGLSRDIMLLTLKSAEAGISGSRLSPTSRQNLPLARVLIKKPELIVFNDGLNAYEETEQIKIKENIRRLLPETIVIWLTSRLDDHKTFDHVIDTTIAQTSVG